MTSKIEEVARAIGGDVWESCSDRMKEQFRAQARAAIEAMKEPTEAMSKAAYEADGTSMMLAIAYEDVWREMIDAALAEGPLSPQSTG